MLIQQSAQQQVQQQSSQLKIISTASDDASAWADVAMLGAERTVSPALAEQLLKRYPSLAHHACKSEKASARRVSGQSTQPATFGERLVGALLPHAAEHIAIELLVAAYPGELFAGATRLLEHKEQTMRVRLSLPKKGAPKQVFEALAGAIEQLNELLALR